jgi:hypothetical protein
MTATTLPRPTIEQSPAERLEEVDRQLAQIDDAYRTGAHGWDEHLQSSRRRLREEKAALLGVLGRDGERLALLRELALEA